MSKRLISLLLVLVMLTGMLPVFAQAEETETSVDNGELTVEGTNSFGNLVSGGMSQAMQNTENSGDYEGGYSVTGLEIIGNTATVTYDSLEEAVLVVAIYTEDGTRLLTSATQTVTAGETEAKVVLPEIKEEFFLAEAFLLDNYDHSPLCASFETPMYTSDMQELLKSTVDDYEADRVYNLDQDKTTNFAVFTDNTLVIEEEVGINTLTGIDDVNYTYVFENADARITTLSTGSVVAYLYGEDEMLLFKTESVALDGTTATVTGTDMEIDEVFAYMKLENTGDTSQITVDTDYTDEGITYEGLSGGQQTRSWSGDTTTEVGHQFNLNKEFESPTSAGGVNVKVGVKGSLKFSLSVNVAYYISLSRQYIKFKTTATTGLSVEVTGEININAWKLGRFEFSPVTGVFVRFEPQIKLSFSGKISISATSSFTVGMQVEHRTGGKFSAQNLSSSPKCETNLEFEGEIFIGVDLHPSLSVVSDAVAKVSMTGLVGISIKGTLEKNLGEEEALTGNMVHECKSCIDGDLSAVIKISIEVQFLKSKLLTLELTLLDKSFKLADFYYSNDYDEMGWGECPHYLFRLRIMTLNKDGSRAADAPVVVNNKIDLGSSNTNGLLIGYLPKGNYTFRADISGQQVTHTELVTNYGSITLTANEKYYEELDDLEKQQIRPDSALTGSMIGFGKCGDFAYWSLYSSGFMKITGSGNMDSYYSASDAPWYIFRNRIKSIHVTDKVSSVGQYAFSGYTDLKKVVLDDCVTDIGYSAFDNCSGLKEVRMPVDLSRRWAFPNCNGVEKIHYTYGTTGKMAEKGDQFTNIQYAYTLEYYSFRTLTTVILDEGITSIGDYAFYSCSALAEVKLPSTLQSIGKYAFYSCSSMPGVQGVPSLQTVGEYAFQGCSALTRMELPEGLKSLGEGSFSGCISWAGEIIIPSKVTSIPSKCFENCFSITKLVIPDIVTDIGSSAFDNCSGLKEVRMPVDLSRRWAFPNCNGVEKIHYTYGTTGKMAEKGDQFTNIQYAYTLEYYSFRTLTTVILDEGITSIGDYAFYSCSALAEVKLPSTLQSIGKYAFYSCSSMPGVQGVPSLQTVGEYAFQGCSALTRMELPEGLKSLGEGSFSGCISWAGEIIIPSKVTSIPSKCFENCFSITKLVIPDIVTDIGSSAFDNCSGLKEVRMPVDLSRRWAFPNCNGVEKIHYTYGTTGKMAEKGDQFTNIQYAYTLEYYSFRTLTTVILDEGITSIGDYAFYSCSALTEVKLPSTLQSIGSYAFYSCSALTEMKLTGDCPMVGNYAFSGVTATVSYPANNETYTEDAKAAFGSTMTWVSYVPYEAEQEVVNASQSLTGTVREELSTADAVYEGDTQTELTDDTVFQISSFEGLVPNAQYVMLALVSLECDDLLTAENLLFIDQAAAAEDGTLSFRYVQRVPTDEFYVFVCGASDKSLVDAQITVPELTANGEAQALQPTVTYEDQALVEGLHYVIVEGAVFIDSGTYTATLRGINQYSGLNTFSYTVAEGEPAVVIPTLTLKSPTLEFKDMITVNAMFTAENIDDVVEMGMITYTEKVDEWSVETAAHVVPGTSYDATTGRYIAHSQGINAKYLGDTVYLACYAKLTDGSYVYTKLAPYSPVQYATNQLKNSTDTKLKQLVAAMLNYGAEAQLFFGHNTDNLANATLTDEQKLLPEAYRADMVASVPAVDAEKQGIFANNKGFAKRYPAISFEGAFCINYFFKPNYAPVGDITLYYWNEAEFEAASVLTKENASGTLTLALEDSGEYRGDIEGIAAKNLSEAVYVAAVYSDGTTEWTSGVLGYSIGAYCSSQSSKGAAVAALAEATAVYGYHAKQFFT